MPTLILILSSALPSLVWNVATLWTWGQWFSAICSYTNPKIKYANRTQKNLFFFIFEVETRPERIQVVITFLMRGMTMSENSWNLSSLVAFKTSPAQLIATILYLGFSLQHSLRTAWRISFVLGWFGTGFSSSSLQDPYKNTTTVNKGCHSQVQFKKWHLH